jgi:phosphoribosylanthranilate isomerase
MSVKVKICGITNAEDARAAAQAGADALGFNFYAKSPRCIAPEKAREIIASLDSFDGLFVGVFVNEESPEAVARTARLANVNAIQLHGDESPEFCRALVRLTDAAIIKALRARDFLTIDAMRAYENCQLLLDAFDPRRGELYGGTGHLADWTLARAAAQTFPRFFLAGGLTPENVAAAVETVKPFGVDVASGVESTPGRKDAARMRKFISNAKAVMCG